MTAVTKETQTSRILKLLQKQGYATNAQLNLICFRYGARLHELRKEGHVIVTQHIHDGLFRFVYRGERKQQKPVTQHSKRKIQPGSKQLSLV